MAKRIARAVREEAALMCAIAASSNEEHTPYCFVQQELGASDAAYRLAHDAWKHCWRLIWKGVSGIKTAEQACELEAEAEALLRCGWEPSNG